MSHCSRCGHCCRLGGAILHTEDLPLIALTKDPEHGGLCLEDLVTLRAGECVRDDVAATLLPLEEECIKIAPPSGYTDWTCRFLITLEGGEAGCSIYNKRPAQCRALDCHDTEAISTLYVQHRVSREEVLRAVGAPHEWLGLLPAHEETCSYARIAPLTRLVCPPIRPGSTPAEAEATEALLETIRYDLAFRELCVERAGIPEGLLPFLLGRPLTETLSMFGLQVRTTSQGFALVRTGRASYGTEQLFDKLND